MNGYDARVVSGEGAQLAVDPNVSEGGAPRETSMIRRRQPIDTTEHGAVWAVADPLAGIGGEGGMVGGSGGTIPLAQALSGIAGVGSSAPRPALRPSPAGLSIGIEPGDDGGGGVGEGPGISTGDVGSLVGANPGQVGATVGGVNLGASVLGGLRAGIGLPGGFALGGGLSPTGGLSGGLTSDNPALNLAMSIGQRALSIPTGLSLLGMVAPALAPLGMLGMGPAMAVGVGKAVGQAMNLAGVPTIDSTMASLKSNLGSKSESVRDSAQATVNAAEAGLAALGRGESVTIADPNVANAMGAAGAKGSMGKDGVTHFSAAEAAGIPDASPHSMISGVAPASIADALSALGLAPTVNNIDAVQALSPSQFNIAMNQGKAQAIAAVAAKARSPLTFVTPPRISIVDEPDATAETANITDITDAPPQGGLTGTEPGGNVPGSPTAGVGVAAPGPPAAPADPSEPDTTDTGITSGDTGGGGPGAPGDCIIASWAMNGIKVPEQDQRRDFFEAFYKYWLKKYPLSGKRQVRKYQLIARRLIEQIARKGPAEVAGAQQEIFQIVIAPTGATLEPAEFDGAYQRLRATLTALVQRYGLQLDPADIPNPSDEAIARMRENRRRQRAAEIEA